MNNFPQLNPDRGWNGLPEMSKYMYQDTYFLQDEDYEAWAHRMASSFANDQAHAERIFTYISNYWFHPSTPVSSNGGTDRGLPISCYVGEVEDSKEGIFDSWQESCWLGSMAGGIGRLWSNVREMGAPISNIGKSSGIIPFMCVDGALTRAVAQGGIRRMSQADYLHISHPEIVEFINIRKPTGDQNRRDQDLHHGVVISDKFMQAVINGGTFDLVSPSSNQTVKQVDARDLWTQILELRATTGEPYILFEDTVNRQAPQAYKEHGLKIKLSNLCTEIMEHTSPDKTNVCCLASLNLEYWDEYVEHIDQVVADCTDFLDNVLQSFIDKTEGRPGFERARAAAIDERNIGLGVMGFHSLLQSKHIPFESALAVGLNQSIFTTLREASDKHQDSLPISDACPLSKRSKAAPRRNILTLAIAPTMSISNLCNVASSGIEPWLSNAFSKKLKQGTFAVRNKFLEAYIREKSSEISDKSSDFYDSSITSVEWEAMQWASIKKHEGSVQHLDWMDDYTKSVFKTAFEIDQRWIIEHAADRSAHIDQGQSVNLFVLGNSHVQYISDLHILAWKKGLKSLYYLRSTNPNRASTASTERQTIEYSECLSCQ